MFFLFSEPWISLLSEGFSLMSNKSLYREKDTTGAQVGKHGMESASVSVRGGAAGPRTDLRSLSARCYFSTLKHFLRMFSLLFQSMQSEGRPQKVSAWSKLTSRTYSLVWLTYIFTLRCMKCSVLLSSQFPSVSGEDCVASECIVPVPGQK